MNSTKVLVTGGTGFTGGYLCERLVRDGYDVRAVVRNPQKAGQLVAWGVKVLPGDVRDRDSLAQAVEGVDVVYHIAALFRAGTATYRDMWEINAQGTRNMLDAAVDADVKRFVHCSTIGVHGDVENPPANEASPYNPGDAYQETKLEGELIAQEYMKEGHIPVTIFRPAGIFGPRDMRFLKLVKSIRRGRFVMIGSGEIDYHMIYIDDLVDGILLCGQVEQAIGNVYILAGGQIVTLNQLVAEIADLVDATPPRLHVPFKPVYWAGHLCEVVCRPLDVDPPLFRRRVDFFRKTRAFDIAKARAELGFDPKTELSEGLRRTISWYQQQELL